jgi:hypothetical protein
MKKLLTSLLSVGIVSSGALPTMAMSKNLPINNANLADTIDLADLNLNSATVDMSEFNDDASEAEIRTGVIVGLLTANPDGNENALLVDLLTNTSDILIENMPKTKPSSNVNMTLTFVAISGTKYKIGSATTVELMINVIPVIGENLQDVILNTDLPNNLLLQTVTKEGILDLIKKQNDVDVNGNLIDWSQVEIRTADYQGAQIVAKSDSTLYHGFVNISYGVLDVIESGENSGVARVDKYNGTDHSVANNDVVIDVKLGKEAFINNFLYIDFSFTSNLWNNDSSVDEDKTLRKPARDAFGYTEISAHNYDGAVNWMKSSTAYSFKWKNADDDILENDQMVITLQANASAYSYWGNTYWARAEAKLTLNEMKLINA